MARYTGSKHKLARREGINIIDKVSGNQAASLQRRLNMKPGVHGMKRARKLSEFGQQLREKQRAKNMYGVLEKQFSNLVKDVQKMKGDTSEAIVATLERRLDNIVYRLGFAKSRFMARQFVGHGHVLVNGKKLTIPSYTVREGDVVELGAKIQKNPDVIKLLAEDKVILPFLERKATVGKLARLPKKEDVEVPFDVQMIIEYYSR
ncbi:MAG TPA: 30S ribosomal protein S4 [Patescibacteria group bacterium]|nr:30S ribosomal protein S4 [Patescibacteria group bacterium]